MIQLGNFYVDKKEVVGFSSNYTEDVPGKIKYDAINRRQYPEDSKPGYFINLFVRFCGKISVKFDSLKQAQDGYDYLLKEFGIPVKNNVVELHDKPQGD